MDMLLLLQLLLSVAATGTTVAVVPSNLVRGPVLYLKLPCQPLRLRLSQLTPLQALRDHIRVAVLGQPETFNECVMDNLHLTPTALHLK